MNRLTQQQRTVFVIRTFKLNQASVKSNTCQENSSLQNSTSSLCSSWVSFSNLVLERHRLLFHLSPKIHLMKDAVIIHRLRLGYHCSCWRVRRGKVITVTEYEVQQQKISYIYYPTYVVSSAHWAPPLNTKVTVDFEEYSTLIPLPSLFTGQVFGGQERLTR